MSELHYETLILRRPGLTRDVPESGNEDLRWVANSATLIYESTTPCWSTRSSLSMRTSA